MRIKPAREAIAVNARTAAGATGLTCLWHAPDSAVPPVFYVGGYRINYREASLNYGFVPFVFGCRLLVARAPDDASAQELLDEFLSPGATHIVPAIECDPTLGGLADDLAVDEVGDYGPFEIAGTKYLGVDITVRVVAPGK